MSRSDEVVTALVAAASVLLAAGATVAVVSWLRDGSAPPSDGPPVPSTAAAATEDATVGATTAPATDPVPTPPAATVACRPQGPGEAAPEGGSRPVRFVEGVLEGADLDHATSIDVGPDGRVYAAQQDGLLVAFTVERRGPADFLVVDREEIDLVRRLPNHDDEGRPEPGVVDRLVTGLLVAGTPDAPCLYVTSSDPRIGGGPGGTDLGGDTNSGIISRLDRTATGWQRTDLVRGLPRSREAHATNGLALDASTDTLYVAQGGNTNAGLPSPEFVDLPEYALSGAILAVDLGRLGEPPYDLPTLGRPAGAPPFGGAGGAHQAMLDPAGPVTVHSPGWRNPYDVALTSAGRLYSFDNSPAATWGVPPAGDDCRTPAASGFEGTDALSEVVAGAYAGHPNPARGTGLAVVGEVTDPRQCRSVPNAVDPAVLATGPASTNGLTEYRSGAFGGALRGDLLAAEFTDRIVRIDLDDDGSVVGQETLVQSFGGQPLDVTAQADGQPHAGTVWIAVWQVFTAESSIVVLEPDDPGAP